MDLKQLKKIFAQKEMQMTTKDFGVFVKEFWRVIRQKGHNSNIKKSQHEMNQ
ncbi:MAG: hypothetical protein M0R51_09450 [Clostridia bacterium]|jgi:hypothetical protein|nr:hypothetical protein [Clostridia bacterium]